MTNTLYVLERDVSLVFVMHQGKGCLVQIEIAVFLEEEHSFFLISYPIFYIHFGAMTK